MIAKLESHGNQLFLRMACVAEIKKTPDPLLIFHWLEGAIVTAQVSKKPKAAEIAKRATRVLVEKEIPRKNRDR